MIVTETEYQIPQLEELVQGFTYEKLTSDNGWVAQVQMNEPTSTEIELFGTLLSLERIRVPYTVTREIEPPTPTYWERFTTWLEETPFFVKYIAPVLSVAAPVVLLVLTLLGLLFLQLLPGGLLVQQVFKYFLLAVTAVTLARIGDRILRYAFDKFNFGKDSTLPVRDYSQLLLIAMGVLFAIANLTK